MEDQRGLITGVGIFGGLVCLLACLLAYLISLPISSFGDGDEDLLALRMSYQMAEGGGGGAAMAAVAQAEYDKYGNTECGANYWPQPESWCCDFVYWCASQLGLVGQGLPFGTWTGYCPTAVYNLHAAGAMAYYPTDGTIPQPGDIIFFSSYYGRPGRQSDGITDWMDHVGIVISGTAQDVTIIEGNAGNKLKRNTYSLLGRSWSSSDGDAYIETFYRPQYPASDTATVAGVEGIYRSLVEELGINSAAACGILANMEHESGFRPDALGDDGTSYGLCQWHNGRFTRLISYCTQRGLDYTTVTGQIQYLRYELTTFYPSTWSYLQGVENSAQGAYDAAYYWCYHFEIPADRAWKSAQRGASARDSYWPNYGRVSGSLLLRSH